MLEAEASPPPLLAAFEFPETPSSPLPPAIPPVTPANEGLKAEMKLLFPDELAVPVSLSSPVKNPLKGARRRGVKVGNPLTVVTAAAVPALLPEASPVGAVADDELPLLLVPVPPFSSTNTVGSKPAPDTLVKVWRTLAVFTELPEVVPPPEPALPWAEVPKPPLVAAVESKVIGVFGSSGSVSIPKLMDSVKVPALAPDARASTDLVPLEEET
jgi:hypothetical protein